MDIGQMHHVFCLSTPQLLAQLTMSTNWSMARLNWPGGWTKEMHTTVCSHMYKLQIINTECRRPGSRLSTSSSALLKHYRWLPIHQCIQFKIACITYKTIHTTQPCLVPPHSYPSASDSASLSPTLRALQIKFTYLLTYLQMITLSTPLRLLSS